MKKLFSLFAVLFVLLSSVGSSAYAVSTALTPKYETLAQNFIAKVSAAKSKYTNDTDYYNFLVALEDQLVAYRTKNYSKVVARNLATRLIDDVGAIRSTYEDDGTALALDGLLGGTIVPTSQLTPAPTSANTVVASTSVTSTSPASNGNAGVVRSPIIIPTAAPAAQVPTERFPGIDGVLGTSDDCDAIKVDGITWAACDLGDGRWYQWGRNVWFAPGVTAGSSNTYNLGYATYSGTGDGFRYSFVNIDNNDNLAAAMNSKKIFVISGGDAAQYGGGG